MTELNFDRHAVKAFRFVRCEFSADSGVARLVYAFDDGPELVETIGFPGAPFVLDAARARAVQQALRLLRGAAGSAEGFQLVCLDYCMPGINGLELAAAIKADPALASVRCLLLSAARETPTPAPAVRWGPPRRRPLRPLRRLRPRRQTKMTLLLE